MSEQNKRLMRSAIEKVWNEGDFALVDQFVVNDFVIHPTAAQDEIRGAKGVKRFYSALHRAFPDIRFTIEEQISEGDKVVTRWTARATHSGEFLGIPPTGKEIWLSGIEINRFVDGKVAECWNQYDDLGLLQQLGAVPEPGRAEQ